MKIFIVEDLATHIHTLCEALKEHNLFVTNLPRQGKKQNLFQRIVQEVITFQPNVILLDHDLGEVYIPTRQGEKVTGDELLHELRKAGVQTPVLGISSWKQDYLSNFWGDKYNLPDSSVTLKESITACLEGSPQYVEANRTAKNYEEWKKKGEEQRQGALSEAFWNKYPKHVREKFKK